MFTCDSLTLLPPRVVKPFLHSSCLSFPSASSGMFLNCDLSWGLGRWTTVSLKTIDRKWGHCPWAVMAVLPGTLRHCQPLPRQLLNLRTERAVPSRAVSVSDPRASVGGNLAALCYPAPTDFQSPRLPGCFHVCIGTSTG